MSGRTQPIRTLQGWDATTSAKKLSQTKPSQAKPYNGIYVYVCMLCMGSYGMRLLLSSSSSLFEGRRKIERTTQEKERGGSVPKEKADWFLLLFSLCACRCWLCPVHDICTIYTNTHSLCLHFNLLYSLAAATTTAASSASSSNPILSFQALLVSSNPCNSIPFHSIAFCLKPVI